MYDDTVSAVSFSHPGKSTTAAVRAPQPLQKPAYDMYSFMFIMTASIFLRVNILLKSLYRWQSIFFAKFEIDFKHVDDLLPHKSVKRRRGVLLKYLFDLFSD